MNHGLLLIDDHVAVAQALVGAFRAAGFDPVESLPAEQLSVDDALSAVERLHPKVALVDLNLGKAGSGLRFVPALTEAGVRTVVFTASNAAGDLAASLHAGAVGFINKAEPFDVITEYVQRAATGEDLIPEERRAELLAVAEANDASSLERMARYRSLTARELQVLAALTEGHTAKEIARDQGIAVGTVRNHVKAIRLKLGVQTQLAAVAIARELGSTPDHSGY